MLTRDYLTGGHFGPSAAGDMERAYQQWADEQQQAAWERDMRAQPSPSTLAVLLMAARCHQLRQEAP